ncbi:hypothetical protein EMIT0P44_150008 [Pseudomonas sp. IT-P44]
MLRRLRRNAARSKLCSFRYLLAVFSDLSLCFSSSFLTLLVGQAPHLTLDILPYPRIVLQLSQVRPRLLAEYL